ncbi:MAG: sugar ABC transporter permease [Demequinaceae bacterium]|nr:sugar ABC transporter permease [Demequinaceae bacterium]
MQTKEASGTRPDPADTMSAGSDSETKPEKKTRTPEQVRRRGTARKWGEISLFTGPALLVFLIFVVLPVGLAAYYSFYNWNGIEDLDNFIGLDNYRRAFGDSAFVHALRNNLFVIVMSLLVQLPVALAVALVLNRKFRGRSFMRMVIFAPYILSEVITAVLWLLILQPHGPLDAWMENLGLGGLRELWLADLNLVMWTVFFVVSWKYIGLAIILFLAGLSGVPKDLQEAAAIDGASWWQIQRRINIPLIAPTIRVWMFLSIIGSIQLFDMVWVLTRGGPAGASNTIATYMFQYGFMRSQYGYGSAVAVILFFLSLIAALLYMVFVLRRDNIDEGKRR